MCLKFEREGIRTSSSVMGRHGLSSRSEGVVQGPLWPREIQGLSTPCLPPQGRMSAWSLCVCIHALHLTSSAYAACCHPRTMCALRGTEGRVLQGMVSRHWYQDGARGKGIVGTSLMAPPFVPQVAQSSPPLTITHGSYRTQPSSPMCSCYQPC